MATVPVGQALRMLRYQAGPRPVNTNSQPVSSDDLAQMSGLPDAAALGSGHLTTMQMLQLMQRRNQIATQQSADQEGQPDIANASAMAVTPLNNSDPASLAQSQIARGGGAAMNILGGSPTPNEDAQGNINGFDYSKVQPITMRSQLLSNPKFAQLAKADPQKASQVYSALLGSDFASDQQEQQKQSLALNNDFTKGLTQQMIDGNIRRNPTMGWLERRRVIPSQIPGQQPTETWEPVDATMQNADAKLASNVPGYNRPANAAIFDSVPPDAQNAFLQEFYKQKGTGVDDKTALMAASKNAQSLALTPAQIASNTGNAPTTTPAVTSSAPPQPSTQDEATAQAVASRQAKLATLKNLGPSINNIANSTANAILPIAGKIGRSISNLPNTLAINSGLTDSPIKPWELPDTDPTHNSNWTPSSIPAPTPTSDAARFPRYDDPQSDMTNEDNPSLWQMMFGK